MYSPGADHEHTNSDSSESGDNSEQHSRHQHAPPDSDPPQDLADRASEDPTELFGTDTFFDRYAATFSPKLATPIDQVIESTRQLDVTLVHLLNQPASDYPDSEVSSRISAFMRSDLDGLVRIAEVNDKSGNYYLPSIAAMASGEMPEQLSERFQRGEVRILHRVIPLGEIDGVLRLSHAIDVLYDQDSLEEAVEHMKESHVRSSQPEKNEDTIDEYSHLRLLMQTRVLQSVATLDEEIKEKLFQSGDEITFELLDIETTPVPDGLTMSYLLMPGSGDELLRLNFHLHLNRVGKLTIEDIGATTTPAD